jgi:hypothetical protein
MKLTKTTSQKKDREFLIEFLIGCHYLGKDMRDELIRLQNELSFLNDSERLKPLREQTAIQIFAVVNMMDSLDGVKACIWNGVDPTYRAARRVSKQLNSTRPMWVKAERGFAPFILELLQEILEYKS